MAIAALVTGIVGILASLVPFIGALLSLPLGLAAIVTGIIAMRRGVQRGFGVAGLVLGILALLITIGWWILLVPLASFEGFEQWNQFDEVSAGLLRSATLR